MSCNLCEQRWMHGLDGECSRCVAQKRIAELEAEVAKCRRVLTKSLANFNRKHRAHRQALTALLVANVRLRADGERLDWLATEPNAWGSTYRAWTGDPPFPQTLRAAIDAARSK